MRTVVVLLFAALMVGAQPNSNLKRMKLEGTTTTLSGQPLSGVTVTLAPDGQVMLDRLITQGAAGLASLGRPPATASTISDGRGQFSFEPVTPGRYILSAERAGYLKQSYGGRPGSSKGAPISVTDTSSVQKLTIALTPNGSISGRVMNPAGEPVRGITLHAVAWSYEGGKRRLQARGTTGASGDDGRFRIADLPPDRYFVYTDAGEPRPSGVIEASPRKEGFLPTYAPNALTVSDAVPVQIYGGYEGQADIRLRQTKLYTIRGTVTTQSGRSAVGAAVLLLRDGNGEGPFIISQGTPTPNAVKIPLPPLPFTARARTDAEGHFVLQGVSPGTHTIMAFGGQQIEISLGALHMSGSVETAAAEDDGSMGVLSSTVLQEDFNDAVIRLQLAGEITRKIHPENGSFEDVYRSIVAASGTNALSAVSAQIIRSVPVVNLVSDAGVSAGGQFSGSSSDSPTQKVSPGRYRLNIVGMPAGFYVKSVRFGGTDITGKPIEFGGGSAELDIVVATGTAQISGQIANAKGEPVVGAAVSIWPVKPDLLKSTGSSTAGMTAKDGSFKVVGMPPGEYFVAAFDELPDPGLALYPEFLNRLTSHAVRVKLEPNGAIAVNPELVTADSAAYVIAQLP